MPAELTQFALQINRRMSFSSYPGFLTSFDDYWSLWDSGTAVR